ncbi:MAG: hypothetical protein K0Q63_1011, partial [Paenibacillus sp.]|nr:hypothetical protein [Paenibacillus sp.]
GTLEFQMQGVTIGIVPVYEPDSVRMELQQ